MQTYNALTFQELNKRVLEDIERLRGILEQMPSSEGVNHDHVRGQIYALRQVPSMVADAAEAAEQSNR